MQRLEQRIEQVYLGEGYQSQQLETKNAVSLHCFRSKGTASKAMTNTSPLYFVEVTPSSRPTWLKMRLIFLRSLQVFSSFLFLFIFQLFSLILSISPFVFYYFFFFFIYLFIFSSFLFVPLLLLYFSFCLNTRSFLGTNSHGQKKYKS